MKQNFSVKVFNAKHYLGLEIRRLNDGNIHVNQQSYIAKLLVNFDMAETNSVSTPCDTSVNISMFTDQNSPWSSK